MPLHDDWLLSLPHCFTFTVYWEYYQLELEARNLILRLTHPIMGVSVWVWANVTVTWIGKISATASIPGKFECEKSINVHNAWDLLLSQCWQVYYQNYNKKIMGGPWPSWPPYRTTTEPNNYLEATYLFSILQFAMSLWKNNLK